jgi:hypothetical protein
MDRDVERHQEQLDAAGKHLDRLRALHERLQGDFARLRRAFSDDWHRIRSDAQAGFRELHDELGHVDHVISGWHDEEVRVLDQSLAEVTAEVSRLHAEDPELRALIEEAQRRRQALTASTPADQRDAVERYSASVQDLVERWRRTF